MLDIKESVKNILSSHGLTGCDTVGVYHGIGKGVALNVLRTVQYPLSHLGDTEVSEVSQCTPFMLACTNRAACQSLTEVRHKIRTTKVSPGTASAPKLQTLPQTTEAFNENVACASLQVTIWKTAMNPMTPALNPTDFGWTKDDGTRSQPATPVPHDVTLVPQKLLKLIRC